MRALLLPDLVVRVGRSLLGAGSQEEQLDVSSSLQEKTSPDLVGMGWGSPGGAASSSVLQ